MFFSIIFIVSYIHVQTSCPSLPMQSVTDINLYAAGALRLQNTISELIWALFGMFAKRYYWLPDYCLVDVLA